MRSGIGAGHGDICVAAGVCLVTLNMAAVNFATLGRTLCQTQVHVMD